jgi:histone H3/H4
MCNVAICALAISRGAVLTILRTQERVLDCFAAPDVSAMLRTKCQCMIRRVVQNLWQAESYPRSPCNAAESSRRLQNKAKAPPTDASNEPADKPAAGFPRLAVKRIIMLDADQTRIAADALDLTSCAAEMFLETLASKARGEASGAARSTVSVRDVGAHSRYALLRRDTPMRLHSLRGCNASSCSRA